MPTSLLVTKLFIPPTRPEFVPRPRLIERLNGGLHRKLTLISAPAGFGKTTLAAEWLDNFRFEAKKEGKTIIRIAWLSLDESDNDYARFLTYFIAALNRAEGTNTAIGEGVLNMLQSPQPPPTKAILSALINEVAAIPDRILLVLDDYHIIESPQVDDALTFLLENLPPNIHLVITTREDPHLPLSRLRARGQLTELRAADLSFTSSEVTEFLNQVMDLDLSAEDITALESRTEGWIAGLQLAAISLQGKENTTKLIRSFSGSHRLVLDYLIEEVLDQQSESVQIFLLQTAILDRLNGSLCDAVRFGKAKLQSSSEGTAVNKQDSGQAILEYLDHANLFIVPLDEERHWYRYHHLFADLLRQRLHQSAASSSDEESVDVAELHKRASLWYENNGMEIESFQHAVAANDFEHAARLVEGDGMPLHLRGALIPVLNWLESLPTTVLDARPSLWVMYGSALLLAGQLTSVEGKLQSAEAALAASPALQDAELDDQTKFLVGFIASARAALASYVMTSQPIGAEQKLQAAEAAMQDTESDEKSQDLVGLVTPIRFALAINQHQVETVIVQSRRALEYLHPDNPFRITPTWLLGVAYQLQGDLVAARQAYTEAISMSQAVGAFLITIPATIGLGNVQETENQLYLAAESYRRGLQLGDDQPLPVACEAYLGLARIHYQWNDLDAAQQYRQQSVQLARQLENTDNIISCELFHAHLKLAQADVFEAAAVVAQTEQFVRQHNFIHRMPEVAAAQVPTLLHQGDLVAAADMAEKYQLPISLARVHLAQGETSAALAVLERLRQQVEAMGWQDERLLVMVLQAVALDAHGEEEQAVGLLGETLALAEPGGFIRIFVDEGPQMARLLHEVLPRAESQTRGTALDYTQRLLAAFPDAEPEKTDLSKSQAPESELVEPLSERELEVLSLMAEGLKYNQIAEELIVSLNTIRSHTKNIYGKLGVNNRTQAIKKARDLNLL